MSREIKFRAWDKLNKRMTNTNICIDFINNMCHLFDEEFKSNPSYINDFIPLQYTGLKDKSDYDLDVFEKDILEDKGGNRYLVLFNKGRFVAKHIRDGRKLRLDKVINERLGVAIGNIYENSELLEEA